VIAVLERGRAAQQLGNADVPLSGSLDGEQVVEERQRLAVGPLDIVDHDGSWPELDQATKTSPSSIFPFSGIRANSRSRAAVALGGISRAGS
jgi:hypothetical protein